MPCNAMANAIIKKGQGLKNHVPTAQAPKFELGHLKKDFATKEHAHTFKWSVGKNGTKCRLGTKWHIELKGIGLIISHIMAFNLILGKMAQEKIRKLNNINNTPSEGEGVEDSVLCWSSIFSLFVIH